MADLVEITYSSIELDESIGVAENTGLTINDASYLWLVQELDAELVTLYKKLGQVAGSWFKV